MKEAHCRICCGVLFRYLSVDDSGRILLVTDGAEVELEQYGSNDYIKCPHCAAKNIATRSYNSESLPELDIVAAVMEDDLDG
jgi:hypothetical protein